VAVFFGLSGFLIHQSASTSFSFSQFFFRRFRRIFPGFILVLITTSLIYYPLYQYTSTGTLKNVNTTEQLLYFGKNLFLHIFKPEIANSLNTSITQNWNPSLWTLEFEFVLYLTCFMIFRFLGKVSRFFVPVIGLTFAIICRGSSQEAPFFEFFYLAQFYFFGMTLWHYKKRIVLGGRMLILLLVSTAFAYLFIEEFFLTSALCILLVLSICLIVRPGSQSRHDYSYGIYLHSGPVTHLVVAAVQASQLSLWIAYLISLVASGLAGMLSWHLVESRFSNRSK
jgi:peptidoglycan/LPS O-acetylase OafA/YrhL